MDGVSFYEDKHVETNAKKLPLPGKFPESGSL